MNANVVARSKVLAKVGYILDKTGRGGKSKLKKTQEVIGEPGSSGAAKRRALKKCGENRAEPDITGPCSIEEYKKLRKKRKQKEHVDRINKHYASKSERMGRASKPKVRRVVSDVTRKKR